MPLRLTRIPKMFPLYSRRLWRYALTAGCEWITHRRATACWCRRCRRLTTRCVVWRCCRTCRTTTTRRPKATTATTRSSSTTSVRRRSCTAHAHDNVWVMDSCQDRRAHGVRSCTSTNFDNTQEHYVLIFHNVLLSKRFMCYETNLATLQENLGLRIL